MKPLLLALFCFFSFFFFGASGVYVFRGDPYQIPSGSFDEKHIGIIRLWEYEGIKYHSIVYTPKVPGTYSVLYFIGGLGGIIPAEFYSELLKRIAGHGYIVIGVDHIAGGVFPPNAEEVLLWLQGNLQSYVTKHAPGVVIAWDHLGLGGHSGGAQSVLEMVLKNPKIANCTLFLEGGWIGKVPQELKTVNFSHPGLIYATEYATKRSLILPQCGSYGQAEQLYGDWKCPRVLMNVTGFGHCDILDPVGWEGCHLTDFCYTTAQNNRTHYRQFTQGVFSAFLGYYVQGNTDMFPYFTNPNMFLGIGMEDFKSDAKCSGDEGKKTQTKVHDSGECPILSCKFTPKQPFWKARLEGRVGVKMN